MPRGEDIAAILNALSDGIMQGMERRRRAKMDEAEIALKTQEMKERHEDRRLARETNDTYRTLLLKQTGERDAATIESKKADTELKKADLVNKGKEIKLKERDQARKESDDESERMLRALDLVRKYGEDEAKWTKKVAVLEEDVKANPNDQQTLAQYKAARSNLEDVRKNKRGAKIMSVGAKTDILPFMGQMDAISDPGEAKSFLDKLSKSGRFSSDSKEMQLLVDEYIDKFVGIR